MNFPCANKLDCECESPLNNLTAEEADKITFYSERDSGVGPSDGWYIGYNWLCDHCHVLCQSDISQQDADDCAERNARLCAWMCIDPTPPPPFRSKEQSCSVFCDTDGEYKIVTLWAGYAMANTQEEADAKAYSHACELATALCYQVPGGPFNATPQTCTIQCADGTWKTYTTEPNRDGLFPRNTQEEADAAAYAFACLMAETLCFPGTYYNEYQICNYTCIDGSTQSASVQAGSFSSTTQATANALAYAYACYKASLLCGLPPAPPEPPEPPSPPPTYYNAAMIIQVPCAEGGIFNYPMAAGTVVSNQNQLDADNKARSLGLERATAARVCPDKDYLGFCLGSSPAFDILTLYGGHPPFIWSITGLPAGIQAIQQDSTGRTFIFAPSYAPLSAGAYLVYLHITDSIGNWLDLPLTIYVAEIVDSSTLPAGVICQEYYHVLTANGPTGQRKWQVYSGFFPVGLHWQDQATVDSTGWSETGIIVGKPLSTHNQSFRIKMRIE